MSTDTKIKTLIFNKLTQEQYNNADKVPTEFYLTPDTSIDSSEKGAANGVASLDTNGKVPTEQIPAATTSTLGGVKPDGTTITVTEDGTISVPVSAEVATKADLQYKVSKAGDTMTGNLNLNARLALGTYKDTHADIKFSGVGGSFYQFVNNSTESSTFLQLYDENARGLVLIKADNSHPYYFDGTNPLRLLTTADLANIDYVVQSYRDANGNWYRVYKSGWLEQGGVATSDTVTLLKPMENANYSVYMSQSYNAEGYSAYSAQPHNRTTTSFSYFQYQGYFNAFWYVCGKGGDSEPSPQPQPILHKYAWRAADNTLVYADVKELAENTSAVAYTSPYTNDTFTGQSVIKRIDFLTGSKYQFMSNTTQDVAYSHEVVE